MTLAMPERTSRAFDAVALGEVMLRLDPGAARIRSASRFDVWEGGGEYNVIRGLSTAFGLRTALVTGMVDNDIGALLLSRIRSAGVDTSHVHHLPFDGIGRAARNALNFTERGFGVRGAKGVSDRGYSAASMLRADDVDGERLFDVEGTRWFHTGGVFAGLSGVSAKTAIALMRRARSSGAVVSTDFNFRPSLWPDAARAGKVFRQLAAESTVVIGGEPDLIDRLGLDAPTAQDPRLRLQQLARAVTDRYPSIRVIAMTTRTVHSASLNDWQGMAYGVDHGVVTSRAYDALEIFDRVGGGDGFAAGLIGGLLAGEGLARSVELGAAHGALAMTTPGDSSHASLGEIVALADGSVGSTIR